MKELIILSSDCSLKGKTLIGVHFPHIYDTYSGLPEGNSISYIVVEDNEKNVCIYPMYITIDHSEDDNDIENEPVDRDEFLQSLTNRDAKKAFMAITGFCEDEYKILVREELEKVRSNKELKQKDYDIQWYKNMRSNIEFLKNKYPDVEWEDE